MHEGHRERLKNRFLAEGFSSFEPHNILELLLFYSIPQKDTNELGHLLLNTFGSLGAVFDADFKSLCAVNGVGKNTAILLKLIPEISRIYFTDELNELPVLDSSDFACEYIKNKFIGVRREQVLMVCMDNRCKVIHAEILFEGDLGEVRINKRKFIECAIIHQASVALIAHNHPNGRAAPSGDDVVNTTMIKNVLSSIDVSLADHIICGRDGNAYSMATDDKYRGFFR